MAVKTIGVLGAGVMGGGIAQLFAEHDFPVILWDVGPGLAEQGARNIRQRLRKSAEKGKITPDTVEKIMSLIRPVEKLEDLADAALVIEAVIENFEAKTGLYQRLEEVVTPAAIVGTNTSSLSVRDLAAVWRRSERFLGVHFFNPPTKLELVELVLTDRTAAETVATVKAMLTACGKTPVTVKDSPGFIVNRLLLPMINEAAKLIDAQVASVEDVDKAMCLGALHPTGPLQLADLIGLDVCRKILEGLAETLNNPGFKPAKALVERVEAGRLGRKTGAGFYEY
jgi:3-hydroxybutyryl-CoA dehydrogenase